MIVKVTVMRLVLVTTLEHLFFISHKIGRTKSTTLPTVQQLGEFVECLKKCYPFINHVLPVQAFNRLPNCWCPMCRVMIDWTKRQCSGLGNMIHECTQRGRYIPTTIYNRLTEKTQCIFHVTAGYFMKFLMSAVTDSIKIFPKLELHYVPQESVK